MSEPRLFGLTERQFMLLWGVVVVVIVGALAAWARSSTTGFVALYVIVGVPLAAAIIHRLVAGHWFDGSR